MSYSPVMITRGLAEMTCIGTAFGAEPLTFLGLAGVGDLFLTCSSPTSRNYTVGYRLGQGESLETIIDTLGSVAEGVSTAKAVKNIIEELDVKAPIATSVSGQMLEAHTCASDASLDNRFTTSCMKAKMSGLRCLT